VDTSERALVMDYKVTFSGEHGQRVLDHLCRLSTINRPSLGVVPGQPLDVNRLIYDEAQRSVVLSILAKVRVVLTEDDKPEVAVTQRQDNG
jgi:hypothetical protein